MPKYDGDMLTYMYEMPKYLKSMIEQPLETIISVAQYLKQKNIEQLYISGSGTSYHAALAAKTFLEDIMNIKIIVIYPMQFKDNEKVFHAKQSALLGISHSGTSTSTIHALNKARELGMVTIACTATKHSELIHHADFPLYVEIGEENVGPKTKGYLGCIVTLYLVAIEYALSSHTLTDEEANHDKVKLLEIVKTIPDIMEATKLWYAQNAEEFKSAKRIIITGYQENLATVYEGTLKILETIRRSVVGYELEEFLHGIYNAIDKDTYMIYIASDGQYYQRMMNLKRYLDEKTIHQFIVSSHQTLASDHHHLIFPFLSSEFSHLQYIIPLQMLAYLLSKDLGINCNVPSDPFFHKKMKSKIIEE